MGFKPWLVGVKWEWLGEVEVVARISEVGEAFSRTGAEPNQSTWLDVRTL